MGFDYRAASNAVAERFPRGMCAYTTKSIWDKPEPGELGDPMVFGRILSTDGGIVTLITPGGSIIKSGCFWVKPCTLREHYELMRYWEEQQQGLEFNYRGLFLPGAEKNDP